MTTLRLEAIDLRNFVRAADWLAVGVAVSLPWSTSATAILIVLWLLAVLPTLDYDSVRRELATAAGGLPVLLWLLAAAGMLWADVSWSERFAGFGGFNRLLLIPLLLAHFRRSDHGAAVLYGFAVSVACLLVVSYVTLAVPALQNPAKIPGVPVKDYVLQSEIFLICAVALAGIAVDLWRANKTGLAAALVVLAAAFIANIGFVITSRTVVVVAPFLIAMLGWRAAGPKGVIAAVLIGAAIAGALWLSSSRLRDRAAASLGDIRAYVASSDSNSTSQHLNFLKVSAGIVASAPLIGHGTGDIAEQFRRTAADRSGVDSVVTVNPHNQFFAVAIQLGLVGGAVLVAMWLAHLLLFHGASLAAWAGALVVVQNIVACLFNSHLFDFSQGWLYVFGVGVAGGMVLRERDAASAPEAAAP